MIETVFSRTDELVADCTGKKANLHYLSLELWQTCHNILVEQAHFNVFQTAEALSKSPMNSIMSAMAAGATI